MGADGGGDRICPDGPDEGTSKSRNETCESEGQQIRFWKQAIGLRDSHRFAVGFSLASTLMPYTKSKYIS